MPTFKVFVGGAEFDIMRGASDYKLMEMLEKAKTMNGVKDYKGPPPSSGDENGLNVLTVIFFVLMGIGSIIAKFYG